MFRFVAALLFAAFETEIAYVAVVPVGELVTLGVLVVLEVVSTGTHCAPELAPGIWLAVTPIIEPVAPPVAPYESLTVVVIPLAPPFTFVVADPEIAMKPPPPPPPGPCRSPGFPPGA
jgi:hypothetical protein